MKFILAMVALIAITGCAANTVEHRNQNKPMGFQEGISIMQQGEAQNKVIESFANHAAAGDTDALLQAIYPLTRRGVGDSTVREFLTREIIPFFNDFQAMDTYQTINGADYPDGSTGLIHYTYIVTKSGTKKPIAIALINNGDAISVVNITVNQCVENRHPIGEGRCD